MTDNAIADRRVEAERKNCDRTVRAQTDMIRLLIENQIPTDNLIAAIEGFLYQNYRRRS